MPLTVPTQFAGQTLTPAQRAQWASQAGFTGQDLAIAVAVSMAENGPGRVDAISPQNSDGSHDFGEWQINDKAHADLFTEWPEWWSVTNANMAYAVWQGSGWHAWTTYNSGAYEKYMSQAAQAAANPTMPSGSASTSTTNWAIQMWHSVTDPMAAIATAIGHTAAWVINPQNWVRVALVLLGGAIIVGTVVLASKDQLANSPAAAAVMKTVAE